MKLEEAITYDRRMLRPHWKKDRNGNKSWIKLDYDTWGNEIFVFAASLNPWNPRSADIIADDWIVEGVNEKELKAKKRLTTNEHLFYDPKKNKLHLLTYIGEV